jgi:hypothetical protein
MSLKECQQELLIGIRHEEYESMRDFDKHVKVLCSCKYNIEHTEHIQDGREYVFDLPASAYGDKSIKNVKPENKVKHIQRLKRKTFNWFLQNKCENCKVNP